MSKLLNREVICTEKPNQKGMIIYYNPDNGEMNIIFGKEVIIVHISKCKIVE